MDKASKAACGCTPRTHASFVAPEGDDARLAEGADPQSLKQSWVRASSPQSWVRANSPQDCSARAELAWCEPAPSAEGCASGGDGESCSDGGADRRSRPRAISYFWGGLGALFFALGALGAVLPLIPTTPFILLAALCFTRSSTRLNRWFRSTKLCRTVFENYLTRRMMTWKEKLRVLVPVFLLLSVSFVLLEPVPAGRVAVVIVFVAHVIYFGFIVKTDSRTAAQRAAGPGVADRQGDAG